MAPVVERRKKIQFSKGNVYEGKPFNEERWVEDKLDGLRGGIIFDGGSGSAVTLTGLPVPNAQHSEAGCQHGVVLRINLL